MKLNVWNEGEKNGTAVLYCILHTAHHSLQPARPPIYQNSFLFF